MSKIFYCGFLTFLLIIMSPNSKAQSNLSTLNPENYFDFWVGKWEVTWEESEGNMGSGTNHIYRVLDNKVLLENFEVLEGNLKGFKGKSMSVYQSASNRWKQAWTDNNGGYIDFTGVFEDEKRIFQTSIRELPNGVKSVQRMVFYDINEDSFIWDWENSNDGGETWTLNWRIFYKKIE